MSNTGEAVIHYGEKLSELCYTINGVEKVIHGVGIYVNAGEP